MISKRQTADQFDVLVSDEICIRIVQRWLIVDAYHEVAPAVAALREFGQSHRQRDSSVLEGEPHGVAIREAYHDIVRQVARQFDSRGCKQRAEFVVDVLQRDASAAPTELVHHVIQGGFVDLQAHQAVRRRQGPRGVGRQLVWPCQAIASDDPVLCGLHLDGHGIHAQLLHRSLEMVGETFFGLLDLLADLLIDRLPDSPSQTVSRFALRPGRPGLILTRCDGLRDTAQEGNRVDVGPQSGKIRIAVRSDFGVLLLDTFRTNDDLFLGLEDRSSPRKESRRALRGVGPGSDFSVRMQVEIPRIEARQQTELQPCDGRRRTSRTNAHDPLVDRYLRRFGGRHPAVHQFTGNGHAQVGVAVSAVQLLAKPHHSFVMRPSQCLLSRRDARRRLRTPGQLVILQIVQQRGIVDRISGQMLQLLSISQ